MDEKLYPFLEQKLCFQIVRTRCRWGLKCNRASNVEKDHCYYIKKHDHVAWFYQIHIAVWIRISVKIYVTVKMNFSGPHKNKLKHYSSKIFCLVHIWSGSFDLEIGAVHGMLFLLVLYLMLLEQNNFLWLRPQSYWGKGSNEDSHAEPGWACHCYSCYLHWGIIGRWSPWRNRRCCNFSRIHDWKVVP